MFALGIIMPAKEEEFERRWKALGTVLWMSYTGCNPDCPVDFSKSPLQFRLVAEIEAMDDIKDSNGNH